MASFFPSSLISFLSIWLSLFGSGLVDLEKQGCEQYQDIYVNGVVIKKASFAERYEEKRFEIVNSVFQRYNRPFSVLDVGAAQGYFTFRGAELYPDSVFTMMEGSNSAYPLISKQVASICELNSHLKNVIWLDQQINPPDFVKLADCEHFDVILLLNILHWFPADWEKLFNACYKMGHVVIVEVPPYEENLPRGQRELRKSIHSFLSKRAQEIKVGVPRHNNLSYNTTYYIIENPGPFVYSRTTLLHPNYNDREHLVKYDYDMIGFIKKNKKPPYETVETPWTHGINLLTYLAFNGRCPTRNEMIHALPVDPSHRDWMPNNMIVSGKKLSLIDEKDSKNIPLPASRIYSDKLRKSLIDFIRTTENTSFPYVRQKFKEFCIENTPK